MPRAARATIARVALLAPIALVACARPAADRGQTDAGAGAGSDAGTHAGAGDGGRRYAARDGGALTRCATAADCAGRGPNQVCFFPQPDVESPLGVCGRSDPPCAVSYPFCTADRRTLWACTFPTQPWLRRGACEDAAAQ